MASLQEERFERVALLVDQGRRPRSPVGRDTPHYKRIYSAWQSSLRARFTPQQMSRLGVGWTREADVLRFLVSDGQVDIQDAGAYMQDRYPSQSYASDQFVELLVDEQARNMIDVQALPSGSPKRIETERRITGNIAAAGTEGRSDFLNETEGIPASRNVYMPHLGPDYDPREVTRAIKAVTDQLSTQVGSVERGNVQFPINSLDGRSIRPGTITPEKVDQESFNAMVRDMPGPEETVRLEIGRQAGIDNDATATASNGAQRVWKVTKAVYPTSYTPRPGPMRVQAVHKGMQFNVMSLDGQAKSLIVRYGLVIKGIPHFLGRIPDQILYATFTGYPPAQLEAIHQNATANIGPDDQTYITSTKLYDSTGSAGRAHDDWITNTAGWLQEHGGNANLAPSTTNVAECEGVKFMLITGTTAKEVYAQLNSKKVNGAYIGGNAQGPTASLPPGRLMESPAPACASIQHTPGGGTDEDLDGVIRTGSTTSQRWRIAYPFSYDACSQLVATDTEFSLVVMPDMTRQDDGIDTVAFEINLMASNGVTVVEDNDRTIGVDIVVV